MYIKQKLIKKINEIHFKSGKKSKYFPISVDNIEDNIPHILDEQDNDFKNMCLDLISDSTNSLLAINAKKNLDYYTNIITNSLDKLSETTKEVMNINPDMYIVGGYIRDTLINEKNKDVDFVTCIDLDLLKSEFIKNGFDVKEVGLHFNVLIVTKNKETFEIANFRKDKDNSGGIIGTIYDDSQRRDFSINSFYFSILENKLLDLTGNAIDDIESKTLRFIGKPQDRLLEDPLRAFRFYRFISKGFVPDNKSLKAVRQNFEFCLKHTTSERIKSEIERIIKI